MRPRRLEELACDEVERDVGLAVRVEEDGAVASVAGLQPWPGVGGVEVQVRPRQVEVALADVGQLAVDLDRVHPRVGEEVAVGARHRPRGVAEDRDTARRRGRGGPGREGQHQEVVPVAAGEKRPGAVERVHGLALVELQPAVAVRELDDARVLVRVSVSWITRPWPRPPRSLPAGIAKQRRRRASGTSQQRHRRSPAPRRARARARTRGTCAGCRASGISSSAARNVPTSEPTVEIAYMRPAVCARSPRRSRASGGSPTGATAPSIITGIATSTSTPSSEPANRADRQRRRTRRRQPQERLRRRTGRARAAARRPAPAAQRRAGRRAGRPAPAEPVADRERDEHDRDRVRPHDRRGAEVRRQQPRRGDLGAQAGGADDERDRPDHERVRGAPGHSDQQGRRRVGCLLRRARPLGHRSRLVKRGRVQAAWRGPGEAAGPSRRPFSR